MKKTTKSRSAVSGNGHVQPDPQRLREMLHFMMLTRELEDRLERKLYRQGKIVGGVYVGRGQEAVSVGAAIQLGKNDWICPSHRDMGAYLIRGVPVRTVVAQYMARATGLTRGRDGNMHMGSLNHHLVAFVSMLGDNIPLAAGIGMSMKMRNEPNVVLCFFGDGATSRGDWHEGVNLAAVKKVPVVYVCNNNAYAYSTPNDRQYAIKDVVSRGDGYGVPWEVVDGNDILAVYGAVARAIARARAGEGPSLIECKTFRMTGHSAHDDAGYVPKELFQEWERKDPIARFSALLHKEKILDDGTLEEMKRRVTEEVDTAVAQAERDPYPEPTDCLKEIYAGPANDEIVGEMAWWRREGDNALDKPRDWGEYSSKS